MLRLAAEAAPTEKTGHTLEYKNQSLPSNHTFHHCSLSKHTHTHTVNVILGLCQNEAILTQYTESSVGSGIYCGCLYFEPSITQ